MQWKLHIIVVTLKGWFTSRHKTSHHVTLHHLARMLLMHLDIYLLTLTHSFVYALINYQYNYHAISLLVWIVIHTKLFIHFPHY